MSDSPQRIVFKTVATLTKEYGLVYHCAANLSGVVVEAYSRSSELALAHCLRALADRLEAFHRSPAEVRVWLP